jgi:hypothetical protein
MKGEIPIRVRIVRPPRGVRFRVQRGRADLDEPVLTSDREISFDLTVRVGDARPDGLPNFLGPYAQGPPTGRFLYVNSGTLAGQSDSCWTRRAKVPFRGVTWAMVEEVIAGAGKVLEARIAGTAGDGGPACATVPLLDGGWQVVPGHPEDASVDLA